MLVRPDLNPARNAGLAESNDTVVVEGNHYFPPEDVNMDLLVDSPSHTRCQWKGTASYYTVTAGDDVNLDAGWYYPKPTVLARKIQGRGHSLSLSSGVAVAAVAANGQVAQAGALASRAAPTTAALVETCSNWDRPALAGERAQIDPGWRGIEAAGAGFLPQTCFLSPIATMPAL